MEKEYPKSRMVARTRRAATARRSQTARHDHDHATHRTPACPPHRTHPPAHARAHASTPKHSKHHLHAHAANAALAHYMTHISMHTAPRRVSRAPLNCVLAAPLTACTAHARPLKAAMAHFHMPLHPQHTNMQLSQATHDTPHTSTGPRLHTSLTRILSRARTLLSCPARPAEPRMPSIHASQTCHTST